MLVGNVAQAQVQWFACAWRGWRACLGAYMRTTHHVRHCCAQNADHLAHGSPLSAFFAEVVCSLAATPPPVGAWPPPNGGNGVIRGTTRRRHAANQLLMLQNPPPQPASCATSPTRPGRRADWRERTRPTQPFQQHFREKTRPAQPLHWHFREKALRLTTFITTQQKATRKTPWIDDVCHNTHPSTPKTQHARPP